MKLVGGRPHTSGFRKVLQGYAADPGSFPANCHVKKGEERSTIYFPDFYVATNSTIWPAPKRSHSNLVRFRALRIRELKRIGFEGQDPCEVSGPTSGMEGPFGLGSNHLLLRRYLDP